MGTHSRGSRATPPPSAALLVSRVIAGSMGMGVTLFALVSWYTHQQGTAMEPPGDPALMFNLMLALAAAAVVAAILFWRARVAPLIDRPSSGPTAPGEDWATHWGRLQTSLVIIWAMIEGASLFAVVVYFLYDMPMAGLLGVALIWSALAITWPKREWVEGEWAEGQA